MKTNLFILSLMMIAMLIGITQAQSLPTNWAGYLISSSNNSAMAIQASWITPSIPNINNSLEQYSSSSGFEQWIGISGNNTQDLIMAGTMSQETYLIQTGTYNQTNYLFYTYAPDNFTILPLPSNSNVQINISLLSQGLVYQTWQINLTYYYGCGLGMCQNTSLIDIPNYISSQDSAEWGISPLPQNLPLTLNNMGETSFNNMEVRINGNSQPLCNSFGNTNYLFSQADGSLLAYPNSTCNGGLPPQFSIIYQPQETRLELNQTQNSINQVIANVNLSNIINMLSTENLPSIINGYYLDGNIPAINNTNEQLFNLTGGLQNQITNLATQESSNIANLQSQINLTNSLIVTDDNNLQNNLNTINGNLTAEQQLEITDVLNLNQNLTSLNIQMLANLSNLQTQITNAEAIEASNYTSLQSEINNLTILESNDSNNITSIQSNITNLQNQQQIYANNFINSINQVNSNLTSTISLLDNQYVQTQNSLTALDTNANSVNASLSTLSTSNQDNQNQITALATKEQNDISNLNTNGSIYSNEIGNINGFDNQISNGLSSNNQNISTVNANVTQEQSNQSSTNTDLWIAVIILFVCVVVLAILIIRKK